MRELEVLAQFSAVKTCTQRQSEMVFECDGEHTAMCAAASPSMHQFDAVSTAGSLNPGGRR